MIRPRIRPGLCLLYLANRLLRLVGLELVEKPVLKRLVDDLWELKGELGEVFRRMRSGEAFVTYLNELAHRMNYPGPDTISEEEWASLLPPEEEDD